MPQSPLPALRSPLRRLYWVLGVLLLLALVDLARAAWLRVPRPVRADTYAARFFYDHVKVLGAQRWEDRISYVVSVYNEGDRTYWSGRVSDQEFHVVPLNTKGRSDRHVMLLEVPVSDDAAPEEHATEHVGLAGPLPGDLHAFLAPKFPKGTTFTRVQAHFGPPRLGVSVTWILCVLVSFAFLRWLVRDYEHSDHARRGIPQRPSGFLVTVGWAVPLAVGWLRFRLDPQVDTPAPVLFAFLILLMMLVLSANGRGRQLPAHAELQKDEGPVIRLSGRDPAATSPRRARRRGSDASS